MGAVKKVSVAQLKVGMFIHDLNCDWIDTPFVRQRFKLASIKDIGKIRELGIRELYIDTSKGVDVREAQSQAEVAEQLDRQIQQVADEADQAPKQVTALEERSHAEKVEQEAKQVVTDIMADIRLGKQIEIERVQPVVGEIVESIFRNKDALLGLGRIRAMDAYTFQHSVGVCVLMTTFAKTLGLDRKTIQVIGEGALLHDIGKMRTPDEILHKPGKLTDEEFAIMRNHVVESGRILEETEGVDPIAISVAKEHHERIDGSGYPGKLRGDEISHYGQMASIVDVYDAITANRCYHKGMPPTEAMRKILEWSKFHFNPTLTQQFIQSVGIYPVGTLVTLESGRVAVVVEQGEQDLLHPIVRIVYDKRQQRFLAPTDLDLSHPGYEYGERITGHESPEAIGIKPEVYLNPVTN